MPKRPIKFILPGGEKVIEAPTGVSLLEAALSRGVPMQYGCREGRCGRCRVSVKGDGRLSVPSAAEEKHLGKRALRAGARLACQARLPEGTNGALEVSQGTSAVDADVVMRSFDATFQVGREALAYLRQGLNEETAQKIAEIIHEISQVDAVAITDTKRILGFTGMGCYYHKPGRPILTNATKAALATGEFATITDTRDFRCPVKDCPCPLQAAVIAPLKHRGRVVGTVKLYLTHTSQIPPYVTRLAMGIVELLNLQMEVAEADRQIQLVTKARLEALQAQIRPHFLFNVLNTIIMFSRTDVEKCRELLIHLASFFRRSLNYRGDFITMQDELDYINTYLYLEQARFGEKIRIRVKVDPRVLRYRIPILTVQPLVENAIVHGLAPKEGGGRLGIAVRLVRDEIHCLIRDDGVGIPPERMESVFQPGFGAGMGLGLSNVNDRIVSLYGESYRLKIRSAAGRGTAILVRIPVAGAAVEPAVPEAAAAGGEYVRRTGMWPSGGGGCGGDPACTDRGR